MTPLLISFSLRHQSKALFGWKCGKGIEKKLKRIGMSVVKSYSSARVKGKEGTLERLNPGWAKALTQISVNAIKIVALRA